MNFLQGYADISCDSHSERQAFLTPPTGLNQHSPKFESWNLWITLPVAITTVGCPLNASSLSLSTSFIPCTLLGKTGKHSLGNALTTGWILFPHKSEFGVISVDLPNTQIFCKFASRYTMASAILICFSYSPAQFYCGKRIPIHLLTQK